MVEFLDIINVIGVLGATAISTATLFTTRSLQRNQQKASIMATKRSERIDSMREFSAEIISRGKHVLYGIESKETKRELISYVDKFNALLQYEYTHDIELIDCANGLVKICLAEKTNKEMLENHLASFWKMCDLYEGVEHERLKIESMGDIKGSGNVSGETQTFEDIYKILEGEQKEAFSKNTK